MSQEVSNPKLITLGGCVVHHIGKNINTIYGTEFKHHWRRPTVPLMSLLVKRIQIQPDVRPSIAKFILEDFQKKHLEMLLQDIPDNILFLDFIRDILTNYYKKDGVYFTCPYSLLSVEENFEWAESPSLENGNFYSSQDCEHFDFNHPQFYWNWQQAFNKFIQLCSPAKKVIIMKTYFTNRAFSLHGKTSFGDQNWVNTANDMLDRFYIYANQFSNIEMIEVPKYFQISATEVIYGGPTQTHLVDEALNWIIIQAANKLDLPLVHAETHYYQHAMNRAESYFKTKAYLNQIESEKNHLNETLTHKDNHIHELNQHHEVINAELENLKNHSQAQLVEKDHHIHELTQNHEQTLAEIDAIQHHSQTQLAEKDHHLHELNQRHETINAELENLKNHSQAQLAEKDHHIHELTQNHEQTLAEIDAIQHHSQTQLAEKDQQIYEITQRYNQLFNDLHQITIEYTEQIKHEREEMINLKGNHDLLVLNNQNLTMRIDEIKNSISWSITKPFRYINQLFQ